MGIGYLIFGNVDSRDYGIEVFFKDVDRTPKRVYKSIEVPGRNGAVLIDENRYEDVPFSYDCVALDDTYRKAFVNALASQIGYKRMQDSFNEGEFYSAVFDGDVDPNVTSDRAKSTFTVYFTRAAQRFLTSGEEPITIGEWHETETASGEIASFEAEAGDAVKSLVADIEPIQSLNGYDKPWSGGAGKNKLNCLVAAIKSKNTGGTWSGNDYTFRGVTYTLNSADGTVVDSIKVVGTASGGNAYLLVGFGNVADSLSLVSGTEYIVSNGASVGTVSYYDGSSSHTGNQSYTFAWSGNSGANFTVGVASGSTVNTVYYPMIRLSSVSDATYEPYSNICPISGYDSVVVSRCRKNLLPYPYYNTSKTHNGVTWTVNSDGTITANGTATSESQFILTGSVDGDDYVGKIFSALTRSSGTPWKIRALIQLYGSPWTTIDADYGRGVTVPNTASGINIRFLLCIRSGETVTNEVFKPMIRLASETDDTYEPYQGNTYTINLNGTRYGGTLDVASGVLTVTHKAIDLGSLNWNASSNGNYFTAYNGTIENEIKRPVNNASLVGVIASCYVEATTDAIYNGVGDGEIGVRSSNGNLWVRDTTNGTSGADLKSYLSGQTLCYELATPTTVQLTAQEVELLVGLNQIWANSGDVSVEYGTAPNALVNPTLFESSPMLEVEGYGSININDDTVTIQNEVIGTIPLTQKKIEQNTFSNTITCSVKLPTGSYQAGDKIYDPDIHGGTYQSDGQMRGKTGYAADYPLNSIWESAGFYFEAGTPYHRVDTYSESALTVYVKGTSTAAGTFTPTRTITFDYDGVDTFTVTITVTFTGTGAPYVEIINQKLQVFALYVDSTKPVVEGTIYIDLDIGEAWVEDGGEVSPANNVVAIPAEMPKLKSGVNTITYDNTIDYTKITPRWWKI